MQVNRIGRAIQYGQVAYFASGSSKKLYKMNLETFNVETGVDLLFESNPKFVNCVLYNEDIYCFANSGNEIIQYDITNNKQKKIIYSKERKENIWILVKETLVYIIPRNTNDKIVCFHLDTHALEDTLWPYNMIKGQITSIYEFNQKIAIVTQNRIFVVNVYENKADEIELEYNNVYQCAISKKEIAVLSNDRRTISFINSGKELKCEEAVDRIEYVNDIFFVFQKGKILADITNFSKEIQFQCKDHGTGYVFYIIKDYKIIFFPWRASEILELSTKDFEKKKFLELKDINKDLYNSKKRLAEGTMDYNLIDYINEIAEIKQMGEL